jgi:hypothetical protein
MRQLTIVYVAKHGSGGNDDEGAVHHALENLGHRVERLRECNGDKVSRLQGDFVLFHHWADWGSIATIKMPRVFWNFDLVEWPSDPTLDERSEQRREWMRRATELCDLGFCTDGDWVDKDTSGKLRWLPQGADQRIIGRGKPLVCQCCGTDWPEQRLTFTGIGKGGGVQRESFVEELKQKWGAAFQHVASGIHCEELRDLVFSSQMVVCPDSPVTDKYWSNRVWNAAGFGGCVLHPHSSRLAEMYESWHEVFFYRTREELHDFIVHVTKARAEQVGLRALERTKKEHTYVHRCEQLVREVAGRLL